jgi:hypothetical protein
MISQFHELMQSFGRSDNYWPNPYAPDEVLTEAGNLLARMEQAPKFVFSRDIIKFIDAHRKDYGDAATIAMAAGRFSLPYNPMVVEYCYGDHIPAPKPEDMQARMLWLVEEENKCFYKIWASVLVERKKSWIDAIAFPIRVFADRGGIARCTPLVRNSLYSPDPLIDDLKTMSLNALFLAMAVNVRGVVTRPPPPIDARLERARARRGAPPAARDYVTVHIGYVTDRKGRRIDYQEGTGRHVRVHLRRGHLRSQACGQGWQDHREIWIDPVLVNYCPGVETEQPDYLVLP